MVFESQGTTTASTQSPNPVAKASTPRGQPGGIPPSSRSRTRPRPPHRLSNPPRPRPPRHLHRRCHHRAAANPAGRRRPPTPEPAPPTPPASTPPAPETPPQPTPTPSQQASTSPPTVSLDEGEQPALPPPPPFRNAAAATAAATFAKAAAPAGTTRVRATVIAEPALRPAGLVDEYGPVEPCPDTFLAWVRHTACLASAARRIR